MKIENFEQLIVWQKSIDFSVLIYQETDHYPKSEQFGISNQLRRASSSISANIAEGFGRRSAKDKYHFYTIAYGSLLESRSFLHLSTKLGYSSDKVEFILKEATNLQMLLNAFIKSTKEFHDK